MRNKYSGNIAAAVGQPLVSPVAAVATPQVVVPLMADGAKIVVSNLPQDVTENQIRVRLPLSQTFFTHTDLFGPTISTTSFHPLPPMIQQDLFTQTVGPVTKIVLSYDKNGKSTGQASIELRRPGDGQVAFKQYNGRLIDGSTCLLHILITSFLPYLDQRQC